LAFRIAYQIGDTKGLRQQVVGKPKADTGSLFSVCQREQAFNEVLRYLEEKLVRDSNTPAYELARLMHDLDWMDLGGVGQLR
jgi:hypothetical protein